MTDTINDPIPNSPASEEAVLGSVLINPDAMREIAQLTADDFFTIRHGMIYRVMQELREAGRPIDFVTVCARLNEKDQLAEVGGSAYILRLVNCVPSSLHAAGYAETVIDRAKRRRLLQEASALARAAYDEQTPLVEVMPGAIDRLRNISAGQSAGEIITASDMHLEFLMAMNDSAPIVVTGIPALDRLLPLTLGELTILAARPSMGKTTLAWQIARNVARAQRVMYFSNEMGAKMLWRKGVCGRCGVDGRDVMEKRVTAQQQDQLGAASLADVESLDNRLLVDDRAAVTLSALYARVMDARPQLVIVDVIKGIKERAENENRRLDLIVHGLHDLAKEADCHVLALHHINRAAEERADSKPSMSNLRDSGDLEQTADNVLIMHSDDYYQAEKSGGKVPDKQETLLIAAKSRNGARNIAAKVWFYTRRQYFGGKDDDYDQSDSYTNR